MTCAHNIVVRAGGRELRKAEVCYDVQLRDSVTKKRQEAELKMLKF